MTTYRAIAGQSIYDVCLQTYGSLDYLYKLMQDNGIDGLDEDVLSGRVFVWDDSLVVDQQINVSFAASETIYATSLSQNGSVFFVNTTSGGQTIQPNPTPIPAPVNTIAEYSVTYGTHFTSSADGTNVITPLDSNGNNLIGADIVQVEKEIKALTPSQYSWNKTTGVLTLLGGLELDEDESIFILYSKTVSA